MKLPHIPFRKMAASNAFNMKYLSPDNACSLL